MAMAPRAGLLLAVVVLACMAAAASAHGGYGATCPRDTLKLKVCANVLNLVKAKVGVPRDEPCCSLLHGLVDLDAAVCLCTALKADVLGIEVNVPIDLRVILNNCGKVCPTDFRCAHH